MNTENYEILLPTVDISSTFTEVPIAPISAETDVWNIDIKGGASLIVLGALLLYAVKGK
jgi:hypothetical protein